MEKILPAQEHSDGDDQIPEEFCYNYNNPVHCLFYRIYYKLNSTG
jgi:hypothetical protein